MHNDVHTSEDDASVANVPSIDAYRFARIVYFVLERSVFSYVFVYDAVRTCAIQEPVESGRVSVNWEHAPIFSTVSCVYFSAFRLSV